MNIKKSQLLLFLLTLTSCGNENLINSSTSQEKNVNEIMSIDLLDKSNLDKILENWKTYTPHDLNNLIFDIPWVADYMRIKRKNERNPQLLHINDTLENVELKRCSSN